MRAFAMPVNSGPPRGQSGFTMIELSVALVVALFLLAGLFTMEQSTRQTSQQQTQLAQLQDGERLAMTIMTDVIQNAGFYPDPTANQAILALPTVTSTPNMFVAGQGVYGVTAAGVDSVYIQYMSGGSVTDNAILCNGQQNTTGAPVTYINQFSVDPVKQQLLCTLSTNTGGVLAQVTNPPVELVDGVQNMTILYGVATPSKANGYTVDTYMTAAQIQAGTSGVSWNDVSSVQVTITFTNPLATTPAGLPVTGQPATVKFHRVIGIMSRTGVSS